MHLQSNHRFVIVLAKGIEFGGVEVICFKGKPHRPNYGKSLFGILLSHSQQESGKTHIMWPTDSTA